MFFTENTVTSFRAAPFFTNLLILTDKSITQKYEELNHFIYIYDPVLRL